MDAEKRLDPDVLENSVLELVEATKTKLGELVAEVGSLKEGNVQLALIVDKVKAEVAENSGRLATANSVLSKVQAENTDLTQLRDDKTRELTQKKEELADQLGKSEKQHSDIRSKVKTLEDEQRSYKETREAEGSSNKQRLVVSRRNISKLDELVALRDADIAKLKAELQMLRSKETSRLDKLEAEKKKLLAMFGNV